MLLITYGQRLDGKSWSGTIICFFISSKVEKSVCYYTLQDIINLIISHCQLAQGDLGTGIKGKAMPVCNNTLSKGEYIQEGNREKRKKRK
jgi:hypothetical protein